MWRFVTKTEDQISDTRLSILEYTETFEAVKSAFPENLTEGEKYISFMLATTIHAMIQLSHGEEDA